MNEGIFNAVRQALLEEEGEVMAQETTGVSEEEIAQLAQELGVSEEQLAEFSKGVNVEMEHIETVGGDKLLVAKIALDHIKETPAGKSYYDALAEMEHELKETPEEEAEEESEEEPVAVESKKADEAKIPDNPAEVDLEGKTQGSLREEATTDAGVADGGPAANKATTEVEAEKHDAGLDKAKDEVEADKYDAPLDKAKVEIGATESKKKEVKK